MRLAPLLAELDLYAESWQFQTLLVALFQPLLILLLILGLILASAHLLTMIGTRWGDRRTGPKALFFSIGLHALLLCGLIVLVPESGQQRVLGDFARFDEEPIRIQTPPDRTDLEASQTEAGNTPIWEQIAPTEQLEWERFQSPLPNLAELDQALDKPTDPQDMQPEKSSDRRDLPSESLPVPEQELAADRGELRQATQEAELRTLESEARPEPEQFSTPLERSPTSRTGADPPAEVSRPQTGQSQRLAPELTPDVTTQALTADPTPQAQMERAPVDDAIVRSSSPVPVLTESPLIGQTDKPVEAGGVTTSPSDSIITRTRPRNSPSEAPSPAIGRMRPDITPVLPEPARPDLASSISSNNQMVPLPGERPQLALPDDTLLARRDVNSVPSAYLLRSDQLREKAILKYGGSEASENAVDLSLQWLAAVQRPEGYWSAKQFGAGQVGIDKEGIDRKYAGRESDTGVTALAVLAFLGKMNTVDQGLYSPNVKQALRWLVSQQKTMEWPNGDKTSGYLGGDATPFAGVYCHGMATFAIAEAYAVSRGSAETEFLRGPLERAVSFILATQIDDGGWRYVKGQPDGDMSIFGWQVMALKSAEAAGLPIPSETRIRMEKFLNSRRVGRYGGLAGYRANEPPTPAMTAEALFCRQMLGVEDRNADDEAVRYLLANRPSRGSLNYYYWYYGTLAMYRRGGQDWEAWNTAARDLIISEQRSSGPEAGSWEPRGVWGPYGGRIYSTAIATLSLEVYYRYLREDLSNEN